MAAAFCCLLVFVAALWFGGLAPASAQTTETTIRVGVQPLVDVAPLYLGITKGFFKQEHLSVEPVMAQGGGAVTAAVISGDQQFGYGNIVSMMLAVSRGLPLEVVADGSQSIADGHHANVAMVVLAEGPIRTMRDLQGKTVAVNALKTMSELMIRDVLERRGVDISQIRFVEIPNADMTSAIESKRVDAALEAEPYLSAGKSALLRRLFEPYDEYASKVTLATYFTTRQYALDHQDVVVRFKRAMIRSLSYAQANLDEVRRIIPTYTKLDSATVSGMALVGWSPQIDMPSVRALQRSMLKYEWIPKALDIDAMFPADAVAGK
jgi:NitT/TauT family transport system substrate-binding protein